MRMLRLKKPHAQATFDQAATRERRLRRGERFSEQTDDVIEIVSQALETGVSQTLSHNGESSEVLLSNDGHHGERSLWLLPHGTQVVYASLIR